MMHLACPVCGMGESNSLYPTYKGVCVSSQMAFFPDITLDNRLCAHCGFIFNAQGTRGTVLYTPENWKPKPQVMSFSGGAKPQQLRALELFESIYEFPSHGRLLDFGGGTGAFLSHFHSAHPNWELHAIEPGGGFAELSAQPWLNSAYNSPYYQTDIKEHFEAIVVMSVLEHVNNPLHALRWLRAHLAENGILLMQHPDFSRLPGDLLCADHIGKLTLPHTVMLCRAAGLAVTRVKTNSVFFNLACRPCAPSALESRYEANAAIAAQAVCTAKASVQAVLAAADSAAHTGGKAAVFGTSPVGTMAAYLHGRKNEIVCYVDENTAAQGRDMDGIPVVSPEAMSEYGVTDIALAISPVYWEPVRDKLQKFNINVHVPR